MLADRNFYPYLKDDMGHTHCSDPNSSKCGKWDRHVGGSPSQENSSVEAHLRMSAAAAARAEIAHCHRREEVAYCLRKYAALLRPSGWTLLITEAGKNGDCAKALEIFQAVPVKNVWHHSSLIGALGACGAWVQALAALQHLKQLAQQDRSLQPNHVTYSAAIAACARVQRLDDALQLFAEMQDAGLQPDSVTYHIMLSVAARLGDWQQVADLLHSMHSKGLAARPPVYSAYMRQLCRNRDWNQALGVFLVMQDVGSPASSSLCCELLSVLNRCRKFNMAVVLLQEAEHAGLINSPYMHESTLKSMLAAGQTQLAQQLCAYMMQKGRWPTRHAYWQQWLQGSRAMLPAPGQAETGEASAGAAAAAAAAGPFVAQEGWGIAVKDTAAAAPPLQAVQELSSSSSSSSGVDNADDLAQCFAACEAPCCNLGEDTAACESDADTDCCDASNTSSSGMSSSAAACSIATSLESSCLALRNGGKYFCSSSNNSSTVASPARSPTAARAAAGAAAGSPVLLKVQHQLQLRSSTNGGNSGSSTASSGLEYSSPNCLPSIGLPGGRSRTGHSSGRQLQHYGGIYPSQFGAAVVQRSSFRVSSQGGLLRQQYHQQHAAAAATGVAALLQPSLPPPPPPAFTPSVLPNARFAGATPFNTASLPQRGLASQQLEAFGSLHMHESESRGQNWGLQQVAEA